MTDHKEQFKNVLDAAAKQAIRDTTPDSVAAYIHCYVSANQMGILGMNDKHGAQAANHACEKGASWNE